MVETTADKSFDDFYLSDEMLKALRTVGYKHPTAVQAETIPLTLAGIDLIVQSQTGSGKTAAFAIPTIEMLEPAPDRIDVLVLAPTRELAKQVCKEFERLGQYKDLSATAIYGGASYEKQYKALETAQIVSATPGRLLDLAKRGAIDLSGLRIFCLDEADEMLSMGFREELDAIVEFLPEERQSLLFSATVDEEIKSLASGMLYYPEYISLSGDQVAAEAVNHTYYRIQGVGRERDLLKVLEYEKPDGALIFANTRHDTFMVTKFLNRHGYKAAVLNGELAQPQREKTLASMRNGDIDLLVATDVAARGIDISDLSHVFNYTLPSSAEIYVHRTGRTGRAGKSGRAVSLVSPAEMATHFDIMTLYDIEITHRELPSPDEIVAARDEGRLGRLAGEIADLDRIPYGGTLGMARQLLDDGLEDGDSDGRVRMVAKLLSMGESVLADPQKLDAVTGRATLRSSTATARTPEARPSASPDRPPAQDGSSTATKSSQSDNSSTQNKPKRTRSNRKVAVENQSAQPKSDKSQSTTPSPEASGRPKRRRRRSRGARKRSSATKSNGKSTPPTSSAKQRSSRNDKSPKSSDRTAAKSGAKRRSNDKSQSNGGRRSKQSTPEASPSTPRDRNSNGTSGKSSTSKASRSNRSKPNFSTSKMYMNVGHDQFDDAEELVEMVCYMSGFSPEDFGRVSVQSSFSFVQVRKDYFYDIINALNNQEWNGVSITAEKARS